MKETRSGATPTVRLGTCLAAVFLTSSVLSARTAQAQVPPVAPAAVAPIPAPAEPPPPAQPMPPMPPPAVMVAPPAAVEAAPKPPTATESMPASRPEALPPIDVGAWSRVGGVFQGASDKSKVNDFHMDTAYVELHAGGKVHKKVGVTLNLNSNMTNFGSATAVGSVVKVMDAIISFDIEDEFHVWGGHLLVPVDRSNASGPFFMIPWNFPGGGAPGPHEGPSGRSNGVVVWGDIAGGRATYLAGVFDNGDVTTSPLYSGRLRLALLDPEPGFWGNGSYFGDKDLLSINVGGQYQKHGSTNAVGEKDWSDVNVDALLEKKIPGGGWFTAEGAYYHFGVNDGTVSDSLYALAAVASPTVGVGNIQPMLRYQWYKVKAGSGTNPWNLDAAVSYLIKGPALRLVATYSHNRLGTDATGAALTSNSIQLGAQAIFF